MVLYHLLNLNICFRVEKEALLMILKYLRLVTLHLSHEKMKYINFITADKFF